MTYLSFLALDAFDGVAKRSAVLDMIQAPATDRMAEDAFTTCPRQIVTPLQAEG